MASVQFRWPGGLAASLGSVEGHQFGAPNGFGLTIEALDRSGCGQIGDGFERQWRDTVFRDFETRGHLAEKHNVLEPGAAPLEDRYETVVGSAWTSSLVFDAAQAAGAGGVRRAPPVTRPSAPETLTPAPSARPKARRTTARVWPLRSQDRWF
jgi:hypothetical protein